MEAHWGRGDSSAPRRASIGAPIIPAPPSSHLLRPISAPIIPAPPPHVTRSPQCKQLLDAAREAEPELVLGQLPKDKHAGKVIEVWTAAGAEAGVACVVVSGGMSDLLACKDPNEVRSGRRSRRGGRGRGTHRGARGALRAGGEMPAPTRAPMLSVWRGGGARQCTHTCHSMCPCAPMASPYI